MVPNICYNRPKKRRYGGHILDQTWHLVPSCRFHLSILIPLPARRNNEQGRRWHVTVEGNSDLQPSNRFGSTPSETSGRSQFVSESVVHYNGYFLLERSYTQIEWKPHPNFCININSYQWKTIQVNVSEILLVYRGDIAHFSTKKRGFWPIFDFSRLYDALPAKLCVSEILCANKRWRST